MKKAIYILLLLTPIASFCQSKFEDFVNKPGRSLKKEYTELSPNLAGCLFQVVQVTDIFTNEKISALRIQKVNPTQGYTIDGAIAYLDADEITPFLKTLNYIKSIESAKPSIYTETAFKSRGGFQLTSHFREDTSKWVTELKFSEKTFVFLELSDIDPLITIITQASAAMPK